MEKKKISDIFNMLEPKTAMILGIVTGFLLICTIGFIILISIALNQGLNCADAGLKKSSKVAGNSLNSNNITIEQAPKSEKPKVELFIMTYCPYGLQMQKAYLPVLELLGEKADMSIKYVSYIMHEKEEIDENTRQYCIEKEQENKYIDYANCFTETGDSKNCLKYASVDETKLDKCEQDTDKEFSISKYYEDTTTWLNGYYPIYPVHEDLNDLYEVEGSPTLVINGQQVDTSRSPEMVKQTICAAFNTPPSECNEVLSSQSASPGFGSASGVDTDASCG